MIDIMTRLKIHYMHEGGLQQMTIAQKCNVGLRSVQRVLTETEPTQEEAATGLHQPDRRRGRPAKATGAIVEKVQALLNSEPKIMAMEVLRRSREWGYRGSKSAMSALVKQLRPMPTPEPVVRFEGLPGEYAQFDFGEAWVVYHNGTRDRVIFFAGRLKYSRYMQVVIVPNQQAETVVRSIINCLAAFGGSPKEWVFDNPKTIRQSPWGVQPVVLHPYLRDLVAEYRVIPTFCAPRSGNQKGSVERVVGFTKHSFLFARKFHGRDDLEEQLCEWLREVNHERPCSATGIIPAAARQEEQRWLQERPVRAAPQDHPLRVPATVTPTGTVSWAGTPYFASARFIGAPATLFIRQHSVEIEVCGKGERCRHVRRDALGVVQRLPEQRNDMLAHTHGRRKQATFRRQCLLELGQNATDFMTILVHRCPDGLWERPFTQLYELLQLHGEAPMRAAFARCCAAQRYGVEDVTAVLREVD